MLTADNLAARLGQALPQADRQALASMAIDLHRAWNEPQRAYHSLQHLEECLALFDEQRPAMQWSEALLLALLFHDAVYDPRRHDNEARSAEWASASLPEMGADAAMVARVVELVMATSTHAPGTDDATPADTALLLDIDLSVLGSDPSRFAEYEQQIRREYVFVPDDEYVKARTRVMRGFARRDPIFQTSQLRSRLEATARRNLAVFA